MNERLMLVSKKLKGLRAEQDLSLEEAAKSIGVHRETLRKYENDSSNIDMGTLLKILEVYNVEPYYFFSLTLGKMPNE